MTTITYKIDIKATMKDLRKKIKDIAFRRKVLLNEQRDYRIALNNLKDSIHQQEANNG